MTMNQVKKLRKIVRIKKLATKDTKLFVCTIKKTSVIYRMVTVYLPTILPYTLMGINPGKSHGQGPWVSHDRHRLDDSSSANRRIRSCSVLLLGEMQLQGMPRLVRTRLGLQMRLDGFVVNPPALIY